MNAMVNARIPIEIKTQVDSKLKKMNSTPTELINAAYKFVLENDALPGEISAEPAFRGEKTLSADLAEKVKRQWESRAVLEPTSYDGSNFKEMLDEARGEYFARFA